MTLLRKRLYFVSRLKRLICLRNFFYRDADSVQVDINVQESTNTLDSGVTFEADLIKRVRCLSSFILCLFNLFII